MRRALLRLAPLVRLAPVVLLAALAGCNSTPSSSANQPAANQPAATPPAANTPFAQSATPAAEPGLSPQLSQSRERNARGHGALTSAQPGVFDFYLLTLSWSPEYCVTHSSSPECAAHLGFVVHGLWPQNNNGTYPEDCSNAPGPTNPGSDTDLQPTISLVEHEWITHGTCSGLAADAYFATIRTAFHEVKLPAALPTTQPVAPAIILDDFAAANPTFPRTSLVLSCGNNQLTAVEICLSRTLKPQACQAVKSCKASVIRVTPQ